MNKKKLLRTSSILFSLLFLTSCDVDRIGDRISTTIQEMLPNLYFTAMQLGLFIITALVVIFLAYKPFKKKLQQRADYIEKNIKESESKNKEAKENLKKSEQFILDSKKEAAGIVQNAHKSAEEYAQESQAQLSKSIEQQRKQAHKDIEAERNKMLKESKEEIIDAALSTSKEILKREVNKEDNDKFVEDFVEELLKQDSSNGEINE